MWSDRLPSGVARTEPSGLIAKAGDVGVVENENRRPTRSETRPASGAKVAMFAVAIAVVLGALFYGLNNTTVNQAGTTPPNQTAQTQPANPAAPPGMRDVTPRNNTQPGTTTGAATNRPAAPAEPSTDMNKSTPPADKQ